MAHQKHLERLEQGTKAWNAWRKNNPDLVPDLRGAHLSGADLSGANLSVADLSVADLNSVNLNGANLRGAMLVGADLRIAVLRGANLSEANLSGAHLYEADLSEANLNGANLNRAILKCVNLNEANLNRADLNGANLNGANLNRTILSWANLNGADLHETDLYRGIFLETNFTSVDLSRVKGLETCDHSGPSTIDHRTLQRSGNLPMAFLRGVGLPDPWIDYLPSLIAATEGAIHYHSCFISYNGEDEAFAKKLHDDLQDHGIRCWFAPAKIKVGDRIRTVVEDQINLHEKLIVIFSEHSILSEWVEYEVNEALKKEGEGRPDVLFPVRVDDAVLNVSLHWARALVDDKQPTGRHIGDFTKWNKEESYQKAFNVLLNSLQKQ